MANSRIQAGASIPNNSGILSEGGIDFDFQNLFFEIGVRFFHFVEGVAIIVAGVLIIRYTRRYMQRIQVVHEAQRMALNLAEKLVSGFLVIVTATLALKVVGLDLTLLVSALTLGLSFALGDIIKNYVSGILILFKSPFTIGDVVKIKSFIGRVEHIDFQSTTLKTFDKKEITIYNKDILSQSITNFSKEELRRLEVEVNLGRGTDTAHALKVFEAILSNHSQVLKSPKFTIIFHKFSESGLRVMLRFWVKRPSNILKVRSEVALLIDQAFDEVSIISPIQRSIQFTDDVAMDEARKERIKMFYGLPQLAALAETTSGELKTVLGTEEDLFDRDEPEVEA